MKQIYWTVRTWPHTTVNITGTLESYALQVCWFLMYFNTIVLVDTFPRTMLNWRQHEADGRSEQLWRESWDLHKWYLEHCVRWFLGNSGCSSGLQATGLLNWRCVHDLLHYTCYRLICNHRPVLKPAGLFKASQWVKGRRCTHIIELECTSTLFYMMLYVLNHVHWICLDEAFNVFLSEHFPPRLPAPREVLVEWSMQSSGCGQLNMLYRMCVL